MTQDHDKASRPSYSPISMDTQVSAKKAEHLERGETSGACEQSFSTSMDMVNLFLVSAVDSVVGRGIHKLLRGIHHAFANLIYRPLPHRGFGPATSCSRVGMSSGMRHRREFQAEGQELLEGGGVIQVHKRRRARLSTGTLTQHSKQILHLGSFLGAGLKKRKTR